MAEKEIVENQEQKDEGFLVPLQEYLSSGIHIGTKFRTKFMGNYIYKIRPDGLCIFNISKIDERLRSITQLLSKFEPNQILVVCRKDSGKKAVKVLNKLTGIEVRTGRYLPGTLTNPNYECYIEPKVLIVIDVWHDKQALKDALKVNIPIVGFCDSSNTTSFVDIIIPCNNKSKKSLGLIFYILAKEYLTSKGVEMPKKIQDFC